MGGNRQSAEFGNFKFTTLGFAWLDQTRIILTPPETLSSYKTESGGESQRWYLPFEIPVACQKCGVHTHRNFQECHSYLLELEVMMLTGIDEERFED